MPDRSAAEILAYLLEHSTDLFHADSRALYNEARRAVERELDDPNRPADPYVGDASQARKAASYLRGTFAPPSDFAHAGSATALLRELVYEEGCPSTTHASGCSCGACGGMEMENVCAFCEGPEIAGPLGAEPKFRHAADCIWLRIEAAAGPK